MWLNLKRLFIYVLITACTGVGIIQPAQAAMIGTAQAMSSVAAQQQRERIAAVLARPDIQAGLQELGIEAGQARQRVAALTDAEAAALADKLDSLPAGGEAIISALIFVFLVLLVTDILGFTKVFPFTHAIKR